MVASIEALSAEGMGVLYTTHDMEEAERLCDRVGIIDLGRLIAEGRRDRDPRARSDRERADHRRGHLPEHAGPLRLRRQRATPVVRLPHRDDLRGRRHRVPAIRRLAALGGAMLPLELFSPTMRTIAHLTPHAWAAEGFAILVRRGGGLVDVLPQVGVLLSIAFAVLVVAAWRLRRTLST